MYGRDWRQAGEVAGIVRGLRGRSNGQRGRRRCRWPGGVGAAPFDAGQRAQQPFPAEWRAASTRKERTGRHPLKLGR